jgi:small subunit ribosomal protein S1
LDIDPGTNGEQEPADDMNQLTMEQLMETSLQSLKEGEVVRGTVVTVTSDEVMVDIGFKCEGTVPVNEFTDPETGAVGVAVGDELEVFIERLDEAEGRLRLSRERATKLKIWKSIEASYRSGTPVQGRVLERVKGGLAVDIGIRAFLPGSLVDLRPNRRLEDYLETEIEAKIISFDRRRSNVVLSRKALLEEEQGRAKEATMADLEEGRVVAGVVKNITDYGVFVDLGGLDGLLHITDISWGRVGHPSEYFSIGDEVDVVVLRFDRERERVSLGYKQRFEDPWILVPEKYPVGKRVHGKVVSIVDYGAFVVLEEGVEGLIHVSEMSWTKKVKNPRSILEIGREVDVVVSDVDVEKRRLSLSLRATEPNPWEQVAETHHVGSRVRGVVRNLTDFGAFVEIIPGVDGLVHISDMSWTRRINHPSEVVQKGQEVEAVITAIDIVNQRISLSMKELLPNEWEEYANSHSVGDVVGGAVTNVTDFGVFVELSPGVEGLCHISEIDRDEGLTLAEMFITGQRVRCRILRIDWNENRIGLSMHGVSQEGAEEDEVDAPAAGGESAAPVETAMAAALRAGGLVPETEDGEDAVDAGEAEVVEATGEEEATAEASAPEVTAAEDSALEEAVPEESAPEEDVPESSAPEEAAAEESAPDEAPPEESAPEEAAAEESAPEEAAAEESAPEEVAAEAEIEATAEMEATEEVAAEPRKASTEEAVEVEPSVEPESEAPDEPGESTAHAAEDAEAEAAATDESEDADVAAAATDEVAPDVEAGDTSGDEPDDEPSTGREA